MKRFVIIDVETTGVSYSKGDRIIQLAYVVIEDGVIKDRYTSYVNPERKIPNFIQSLTNIDSTLVVDAPLFSEIAHKLLEALEGSYFVAHNVQFDLNFINDELVGAGYPSYQGPILDTVELARIAFPTADGFKLSELSKNFKMNHLQPHRADSDAEATAQLFIQIVKRLSTLPYVTLQQLDRLNGKFKSDVSSLFYEWLLQNIGMTNDVDEYRGIALRQLVEDKKDEEVNEISFDEFFTHSMSNEQWCNERISSYEKRTGQLEMMTFIHETFSDRSFGLVEAGTGTGKTLAYLIPAAFKAKELNKPVVVSTQTVQLQEQLVKKEIPIAKKLLPFPLRMALLKGRSHYLCLRKFEALLHNDMDESYDRVISKAQILVWLTETETGDVEELSLASHNRQFWSDISSDSFSCNTPRCPWFSRCFYQRARKQARKADIIITNHSLVLSDIMADHQIIPSYKYAIIDEAHHFEEKATEQLGKKLDYLSLTHLLNELGTSDGDGLLANLLLIKDIEFSYLDIQDLDEKAKQLKQDWSDLFAQLYQYVEKKSDNYTEKGRALTTITLLDDKWLSVKETVDRCYLLLKDWRSILIKLKEAFEGKKNEQNGLVGTLSAFIERVEIITDIFVSLLQKHEEGRIYWLEAETKGPRQSVFVQGKPINVSEVLADDYFAKKDSVVLTSATIAVNKKFNYMIQRLGLEDFPVNTKIVDSPFQWDNQVQLMVPTDMPLIQEAGENAYIESVAMHIYRVSQVTKGKMLVLFTSYNMLKQTYYLLKDMLTEDYMLIAQGVQSGNRTKLTRNFQQFDQAILLGTSSFWEGVDIPGRDLSVIVIVRLPFSPPDDPIFQAKSNLIKEAGANPFMKLALPQAILRFKQGFGRLIRRSSDKGVVIVLDRRLVSTRYGKSFVKSLPDIPLLEKPMDELEEDISNWL